MTPNESDFMVTFGCHLADLPDEARVLVAPEPDLAEPLAVARADRRAGLQTIYRFQSW